MAITTVESVGGRYEVQEVEFGWVYKWVPERVILECDCGETLTLTSSETVCGCGLDHGSVIREQLGGRRLGDEALHPWRYTRDREGVRLPC